MDKIQALLTQAGALLPPAPKPGPTFAPDSAARPRSKNPCDPCEYSYDLWLEAEKLAAARLGLA